MNQTPSITPPPLGAQPPPTMSLFGRLFNVLAVPGDVFEEVKASRPRSANWLVPAVIAVLVGWACAWLIFSQPAIQQQINDITDQAIQKQIDRGHMSAAQGEQARATAAKVSGITSKATGYLGPVVGAFASPFLWGLLLWLLGTKALKGTFDYMKAVEVVGLSNMIAVLDAIVRTLLMIKMGSIYAAPSLALLIKEFNPQNPVHALLAALNGMTFWLLAVRAIGLARLSGATFGKAALWVFGLWAAYTAVAIGASAGLQAVFAR